jgi:C-3',4' desaturase CrtD
MKRIVVVGGGIGGLSTAAVLARAGFDVTVVEAHVYPGGCAGTFYHQGYRFDAGATLAGGFYPGGPMDQIALQAGIPNWPTRPLKPSQPAMVVHLPDGAMIKRLGDTRRHEEYQIAFGAESDSFWRWQEETADALWDFALRSPHWPPQTIPQFIDLIKSGTGWLGADLRRRLDAGILLDAFRPISAHLKKATRNMRLFIDAQLLISAQTTSSSANALYGAAALDLPRRGVVHLEGGMGAIAETLVKAIKSHGGRIILRKEVQRLVWEAGRPIAVEMKHGERLPAELVILNLPPWNITRLMGENAPPRLRNLPDRPEKGWGAFMVYLGVDASAFPPDFPLHHQVVVGEPLGEGNSIFLSISPDWDIERAPVGRRAITISTHTDLGIWWDLFGSDRQAYDDRKQRYTEAILTAIEQILPGVGALSNLVLPGTPVSFERFTRRAFGWVGGFPQINLYQSWGPRVAPNVWMVGDSIFPGQSTAAVVLGGIRVAKDVQFTLAGFSTRTSNQPAPTLTE